MLAWACRSRQRAWLAGIWTMKTWHPRLLSPVSGTRGQFLPRPVLLRNTGFIVHAQDQQGQSFVQCCAAFVDTKAKVLPCQKNWAPYSGAANEEWRREQGLRAGRRPLSSWNEKDYSLPRTISHLGKERFNRSVFLFPFFTTEPRKGFKDEGDFSWNSQWNDREGKDVFSDEGNRFVISGLKTWYAENGRHEKFLN